MGTFTSKIVKKKLIPRVFTSSDDRSTWRLLCYVLQSTTEQSAVGSPLQHFLLLERAGVSQSWGEGGTLTRHFGGWGCHLAGSGAKPLRMSEGEANLNSVFFENAFSERWSERKKEREWSFLILWRSPDTQGTHSYVKSHEKVHLHFAQHVTFKIYTTKIPLSSSKSGENTLSCNSSLQIKSTTSQNRTRGSIFVQVSTVNCSAVLMKSQFPEVLHLSSTTASMLYEGFPFDTINSLCSHLKLLGVYFCYVLSIEWCVHTIGSLVNLMWLQPECCKITTLLPPQLLCSYAHQTVGYYYCSTHFLCVSQCCRCWHSRAK